VKNLRSSDLRLTFSSPLLCSLIFRCASQYTLDGKMLLVKIKLSLIDGPSPEIHKMEKERRAELEGCPRAIFEQQEPWTEPRLRLRFLYLDPRRSTGSSSLLKSSSSFSVKILALGGRSVALSYSSSNRNRESVAEASI
jgi:hypothetical protein